MVGANKILTVSYGTFSCTLEGFDDPFNTMKAIAEYFRDLAADDRYFGAEPPQPDAAMLHRIAEREMNRQVEAQVEDNHVVLRARQDSATETQRSAHLTPAAAAIMAPELEEDGPESSDITESVAAKLARIRQEVSESRPETAPTPTASRPPPPVPTAPPPQTPLPSSAEATTDPGQEAEEEPEPEDPAEPPPMEEADKLAAEAVAEIERISLNEDTIVFDLAPKDEVTKDTGTESPSAPPQADGDKAEAALLRNLSETLANEAPPTAAPQDNGDQPAPNPQPPVTISFGDGFFPEEGDHDFPLSTTETESSTLDDQTTTTVSPVEEVTEPGPDDAAAPEEEGEPSGEPLSLIAKAQSARARIVRVRRNETGTTRPDPLTLEQEEAPPQDKSHKGKVKPVRPVLPRRPRQDKATPEEADASVKRLIEQTNTELAGPENRRRLSAIAHLKAAVAATLADRLRGKADTPNKDSQIGPYRDDLQRAVGTRPSPPQETPKNRPTPLVLVATQRVPEASPPAGPDNRLAGHDAPDHQNGDFARFAEGIGAKSMPELMEAAAAYKLHVEQHDHITRGGLLAQVAAFRPEWKERREDQLRAFGTLLREGTFQKTGRGRFTLKPDSAMLEKVRHDARS